MLNVIFLGSTSYSKKMLDYLLSRNDVKIKAIFGIPEKFFVKSSECPKINYNFKDLSKTAQSHNIQYFCINGSKNNRLQDYSDFFLSSAVDIIFVLGWYYKIPLKILKSSKFGAWGIHASLLPNYAGGAPLVWAIINNEKETGVTLFKMNNIMDGGEIIQQKSFPIMFEDTIKEVYDKAVVSSIYVLKCTLDNFENINFVTQDTEKLKYYPQRNEKDGEIDLSKNAVDIYNFIRAQSTPYPGAFIRTNDGKKLIIEKARIEE